MHRSIAYIGTAVLLVAIALAAFPIWSSGVEQWDVEQELGILLAPFGLITFLLAAVTPDPRLTTVGGAFGNPEYRPGESTRRLEAREPSEDRDELPRGGAMPAVQHGDLPGPGAMSPLRSGPPLPNLLPASRFGPRPTDLPLMRPSGILV